MQTGLNHSRVEAVAAYSARLVVQPHSIALAGATEIQAAPASDISPSEAGAFVIPFLPFDITPFGLVAVSDAHRDTRKETTWVTSDGSNMTRNRT